MTGIKGAWDKAFLPQSNMCDGDFPQVRRYKRYIGFGMAGALPAVDLLRGLTMKIRLIALAGVAAAALATPAMAADGWYLGLSGGLATMDSLKYQSTVVPATAGTVGVSSGGIVALQTGYKFDNNLRLEVESSYSWHGISNNSTTGFTGAGTQIHMATLNMLYDIPLDDSWSISLGGGAGIGSAYARATTVTRGTTYDFFRGSQSNFAWTGIAAINFTGNNSISAWTLKSIIRTHETGFLSWLLRDDSYTQEQLDMDRELIR